MNRIPLLVSIVGMVLQSAVTDGFGTEARISAIVIAQASPGSDAREIDKRRPSTSGETTDQGPTLPPAADSDRNDNVPGSRRNETERSRETGIAGRWTAHVNCALLGRYVVVLNLKHSSPTAFSGSSHGVTTGADTRVVNGRLNGDRFSFTRLGANRFSDRWSGRLDRPNHIVGSTSYRCSYAANKQ